jgi:nickel/cobalt exporter
MAAPSSISSLRVVALLAVPLLWAMLAVPVSAAQLATWASLAPSVEPYDDPFAEMPFEQIDALRIIARADMAAAAGQLDEAMVEAAKQARRRAEEAGLDVEALFAQRALIMQRREEAALGVTTTHLDKTVVMDGYALPLRAEEGRVVEFLLVPWVGACVHTPPPPANQIVHIDYPQGFEAVSLFTPIRLEGRLTHRPAEYDLFLVDGTRRVATSYAMEQAAIGGTPGEVVAAASASADLSWFAAAQAWITDIFTTAMRNMEQGRSAGTIGLALLIAFAYGAIHTLGPGHGKAVVISYFVGTGGSLRRGVSMGGRIAVMHVLSAVVVVFLLDFAVRQATGAAPSDYRLIRLGSYALIVAIGAVMLWRALAAVRAQRAAEDHAHHHHHHHHHDAHAGCTACAAANAGSKGGGWIAAAVGVVPCTGALIVMLFGLANDLVVPAVMMVVAISAGMALAMSAIGVAAILGRNWTEARVAVTPDRRIRFEAGARIAGAACVLVIGATLFVVTFVQTPAAESRLQAAVAPPLRTAAQEGHEE